MADKIITIELDPNTETMSVETDGFNGQGCKAIHAAFESMGKVTKEVLKPEYYKANPNQNTVRTGR
jgi:hypothetical protein